MTRYYSTIPPATIFSTSGWWLLLLLLLNTESCAVQWRKLALPLLLLLLSHGERVIR